MPPEAERQHVGLQRVLRPDGAFLRWEHASRVDLSLESAEERFPAFGGGGTAVLGVRPACVGREPRTHVAL